MALQKWVIHRPNLEMLGQEFGDPQGTLVLPLDANCEGLDSTQQEKRSMRVHYSAQRGAGGFDLVDDVAAAGGDATDQVGVSTQIFGRGVQNHIDAEL